ncbi:GRIP domain-containing protein RUD3 [Smittium culicis]|uniref:GRIP domain-containing protein RUD3 n=1 Tax=Smittium culicis TaxID=133412 RepID=A0A1R1X7B2_9FUNG|nr:GRIP domain-containing protein RUD3 [Smittium culicis]
MMSSEASSKKETANKKLALAREHLKALALENEKISQQLEDFSAKEKEWKAEKDALLKEKLALEEEKSKLSSENKSLTAELSLKNDEISNLKEKIAATPTTQPIHTPILGRSSSPTAKSPTLDSNSTADQSKSKSPTLKKSVSLSAKNKFDKSSRPCSPDKSHVCCFKNSETKLDLNWEDFVLKLAKILTIKVNAVKTSKGAITAKQVLEVVQELEKNRAADINKKNNTENDSILNFKKNISAEDTNKKLELVIEEKRQLELEYENLLEKVEKMQSVVKAKMKAESEEIDRLREQKVLDSDRIKDLSAQIEGYSSLNKDLQAQLVQCKSELSQSQENVVMLQYQYEIEQRNALKSSQDFENAKFEFEKKFDGYRRELELLNDSKSNLENKNFQLQMDVSNLLNVQQAWAEEKGMQNTTISNLQSALDSLQHANESETNDLIEKFEIEKSALLSQIADLRNQLDLLEKKKLDSSLEVDIESYNSLKAQFNEQSSTIAQLRQKASLYLLRLQFYLLLIVITLNDHLAETMRRLKDENDEYLLDRRVISSLLVSFFSMKYGDSKRYEVLELISKILQLNEQQNQKIGLIRKAGKQSVSISGSDNDKTDESISDMWISYLLRESSPYEQK